MRKFTVAAILAVSGMTACSVKEQAEQNIAHDVFPVFLTADLNTESTEIKLKLDGLDLVWNEGDEIKVRTAYTIDSPWTDETKYDILTAETSGKTGVFSGTIHYQEGKNVYCFYSRNGYYHAGLPAMYHKTIPALQTGTADGLMDQILLWSKVPADRVVNTGGGYRMSGSFNPFIAVLRFNVAKSLGIKSIDIHGTAIRGNFAVRTGSKWGEIGESSSCFLSVNDSGDDIVVSRDGNVISGDVYVAVAVNAFDSESDTYCNSSEKLSITFRRDDDMSATVVNTLKTPIKLGQIKDLGTVSQLHFGKENSGKLVLVDDCRELKLTASGIPSGCRCYYEIGDIGMPDPTALSAEFDPAEGFVISVSDMYVSKVVKVLVKGEGYKDLVLQGYLRNWRPVKASSIYYAYQSFLAMNGLSNITSANNGQVVADGLMMNVPRDGNTAWVTFENDYCKLYDAFFIGRTVNDVVDCQFKVNAFVSASTSNRNLSVYKGLAANGIATNWIEQWPVRADAIDAGTAQAKVFCGTKYNALASGTPLSIWGNTDWKVCSISILETGEITTTVAPQEDDNKVVFKDILTVSMDRQNGVYATGEKVTVYAIANRDCEPMVRIMKDARTFQSAATVQLKRGVKTPVYECVQDTPVHLMVEVGNPKDMTDVIQAGFIVSPETFSPGYSRPSDFKAFWDSQKSVLRNNPLAPSLREETSSEVPSNRKCFNMTLNMPEGRPVRGYISYPSGAASGSLPIMIKFHSAGVNADHTYATIGGAVSCSNYGKGCIGIDINAHGLEVGQPQNYYDAFANGELSNYSNQLITGHENYYFRLMFLRIVCLLNYACSLDLWDGKHLLVIGESQGGAQAFAAAGLDERVGGCVAIVPAMNDLGARFDGRYGSWPFVVESSVNNNNPLRDEILPYYDAAHLVSMSGASFFVEVGLIDSTCPAAAVWSGINNITGDKEIVSFYQRNHTSLDPSTVDRTWWNTNVYQRRDAWIKEYLAK